MVLRKVAVDNKREEKTKIQTGRVKHEARKSFFKLSYCAFWACLAESLR